MDRYDTAPGTLSRGGTELAGVSGVTACQNACNNEVTCVGFDMNANGQCWKHTANTFGAKSTGNSDVTQYIRKPCTTTPAGKKIYIL